LRRARLAHPAGGGYTHTTEETIVALLPFAMLVAGFLVFRLSALMTALWTCIVEFVVVLSYYHASPVRSIEAGLWGNLTMWSVFLLLWSGQIFGHAFRATGLIPVLLESFGSILPTKDRQGRALTMVALLSGFVGTFNLYAVYPVAIPGLAELGFGGVEAATGYLIYASWCIPFAGLFIGAVIASAATNVPVSEIAHASGLLTIPLVFVSIFGAFRILGFRFFARESQILYWLLSLSNVAGVVLFTQIWPRYHNLTLMSGATIALVFLFLYGRLQKQKEAADRLHPVISLPATPVSALAPSLSYSGTMLFRAYAPLLIAIVYAMIILIPAVAAVLVHFELPVAAWGFSRVNINIFTAPAFPIFIAVACCYLFRLRDSNPLKDVVFGTMHGASSLITLLFGSATVYLMSYTGQITFLGHLLSSGGKTTYEVLESGLIFLGGMTFGQGAPAVFLFSRMQITPAAALGLPLALLVGLVNLVAMGPTNAIKPPLIRFAASLVNVAGRDRDIFRIGLFWGVVQIVVTTIFLLFLVPVWK
jgi:lactate permease